MGDFGFCLFSSLESEETEPVTTTVDHADIRVSRCPYYKKGTMIIVAELPKLRSWDSS